MERVTWKVTLPYVKQIAMGICCMAQETQIGALYQPRGVGWRGRWEGGSKGRGRSEGVSKGIYVNLWLIHVEV